jgi:general secretion pathway protein B
MSLILEALKKAERLHKLGEVPGIGAQPGAPSQSGMRGLGWVMLILLAGVMLGLGLYLGGFRLTAPEASEAGLAKTAGEATPRGGLIEAQRQSPPPVVANPAIESFEPPPPASAPPRPEPPPKPVPVHPLSEMPSGFVANLPLLNIDIHSYDRQPAKRYVLINMEKYREGDYLTEGPQLIEVLTDGVVLEHLGERFILPIGNQ